MASASSGFNLEKVVHLSREASYFLVNPCTDPQGSDSGCDDAIKGIILMVVSSRNGSEADIYGNDELGQCFNWC